MGRMMGSRAFDFAFAVPLDEAREVEVFEAYSVGPSCASVCTSLTDPKEIETRMNEVHPPGNSSGWTISTDQAFASGEPMPCACSDHPATHKHWLLHS